MKAEVDRQIQTFTSKTEKQKMACSSGSKSARTLCAYPFTKGSVIEVSSDADGYRGVWYPAKILRGIRRSGKKALNIEYQTLLSDDGVTPLVETVDSVFVRPLPPATPAEPVGGPAFEVNDVVDAFWNDGWWVGVVVKVSNDAKNAYSVFFDDPPDLLVFDRSELRPHWDWVDGRWFRSQKKEVVNGVELQKLLTNFVAITENRAQSMLSDSFCGVKENAIEVANSSKENEMGVQQANRSCPENEASYELTSIGKEIMQVRPSVDATVSRPAKKLRKLNEDTMSVLKAGQLGSVPSRPLAVCSEQQEVFNQSILVIRKKQVETVSQKKQGIQILPKSLVRGEESDEAGGTIRKTVNDSATIYVDELPKLTGECTGSGSSSTKTAAELSVACCPTREADQMSIIKVLTNAVHVEKPISMWFDKSCLPSNLIDSRFINSTATVNQLNKTNERLLKISKGAVKESTYNEVLKENWSLPFVKHSSILRAIESMEVFKKMPQRPHFNHLDKSKMIYLEGLIIGYMLTFANLVEQTSKLQVSDPTSHFESMFEALLDLESHGFDVKIVRSCLTELQSIKEKHKEFQEQLLEQNSQILEQTNAGTKITGELEDVVEQINILEARKAKLKSMKEKNESEIAALKSEVDVVNENIQKAQVDFEKVAVCLCD